MYDPRTYPKSIAVKHSLLKLYRMLQNLERKFELYWEPARYLSINKQTIGFQSRHKDNFRITFKDAGDDFQDDDICDHGYLYSFIYRN